MKTRKLILNGIIALVTTGLIFTGCKKDEEDNDTSGSSDNALAEATFEEVGSISNEAGKWGAANYRTGKPNEGILNAPCAKVDFVTGRRDSSNADTITVDFGAVNCMCMDGKNRRGKLIIIYSGKYMAAGSQISITADNFFVNDHQVIGYKQVTNMGANAAGAMVFNAVVDGKIILANGAGTITWKANKTHEWAGYTTWMWSDDVHSISGSSSGTGTNGHTFTANITRKLVRKMSCPKHFVDGSFDFTPDNKPTRTVDYGTGACDDIATVTVNGKTYTIHLR